MAGDVAVEGRQVYFLSGTYRMRLMLRHALKPGYETDGPVLVAEKSSTVVVKPG
jgi:N-methylhydantoinase A/oxoprolinase/acetone carboxylase beta subunit